jgi:hypothetical protein
MSAFFFDKIALFLVWFIAILYGYKYTYKILNGKTLLASRFKGAQLIH